MKRDRRRVSGRGHRSADDAAHMRALLDQLDTGAGADPARSCAGKTRYSRRTAEAVAAVRRKASGHLSIKAYACRFCTGWHIGHRAHAPAAGQPAAPTAAPGASP